MKIFLWVVSKVHYHLNVLAKSANERNNPIEMKFRRLAGIHPTIAIDTSYNDIYVQTIPTKRHPSPKSQERRLPSTLSVQTSGT